MQCCNGSIRTEVKRYDAKRKATIAQKYFVHAWNCKDVFHAWDVQHELPTDRVRLN